MPSADPSAPRGATAPADVERWLTDLGLEPIDRAERDGITSWDLVLDGRRRFDLRVTVILDPALALICWAHFAPPINDLFRKSYRKLLRWNDEFPFAKFSVGEDERPLLAVELPLDGLAAADADVLGLALARIVGIADRLLDDSKDWLWVGGRMPDRSDRTPRNAAFVARFEGRLAELFAADDSPDDMAAPDEVDAPDSVDAADEVAAPDDMAAPDDVAALDGVDGIDTADPARSRP